NKFELISSYEPRGDQPKAIDKLVNKINNEDRHMTLLGATGTGKTFTVSNVVKEINKPTLIIAHNKTLAGQLYSEFKEIFPNNAVEYFVSYYDYYQPEAYVPSTDTFIEKDASVNEEIDKLRHSATSALLERDDVLIVSSVSCIYGLGYTQRYQEYVLTSQINTEVKEDDLVREIDNVQYAGQDIEVERGSFRVRGDSVEIIPASGEHQSVRVEFVGDE